MDKAQPQGVWFEIYVDDMNRATTFYETVFNTKLTPLNNPTDDGAIMHSFPMQEQPGMGISGALVKMDGMKAGGSNTLIYIGSVDCALEESRVAKAGGQVIQSKFSIGEFGFAAICSDTEGNLFGIHSMI